MTLLLRFKATDDDDGSRVDNSLYARVGTLSRMRIRNLILSGACKLNGETALPGHKLSPNDEIEFHSESDTPGAMDADAIPLEIVHEDEHIAVVVKPAGMLVHPTLGVKRGTLLNALAYHLNRSAGNGSDEDSQELKTDVSGISRPAGFIRPGLVHRLDRATSGLMVIAKTQRALSTLSRHFNRRLVEKRYLAVTRGEIAENSGEIDAPIGRDPLQRPRWRVLETGRAAITRFKVLERSAAATLAELEPVTGRTNQLRIHLAHIGHPIVGDESWDRDASAVRRLLLHAHRLSFHHPCSGDWYSFSADTPADFAVALRSS
ncbi:MAG TPA: RluA family pseudouridine synthase [Blastocatellia bacterium]|nr:RluA family pseudouridine synthase [Blastocatellia bacterium]